MSETTRNRNEIPAAWRRHTSDEIWHYEIRLDGERAAIGNIEGKGLDTVDQIVAMLPDLLFECGTSSTEPARLEIELDRIPF